VDEALAGLKEFSDYRLLQVEPAEKYAANCVRINDHVLLASGYPKIEAALSGIGMNVVALDMSEFRKMDGGLSCLSLRF
jgi:dimethylargininase